MRSTTNKIVLTIIVLIIGGVIGGILGIILGLIGMIPSFCLGCALGIYILVPLWHDEL